MAKISEKEKNVETWNVLSAVLHLFQVFHIATNNGKNTFIFDLDGYIHRRYKKIAHGREMYRHVRAVYSIREKVEKKKEENLRQHRPVLNT